MGEVSDRLKGALADRYAIEREVGAGGMATVYLARDLRHDRRVAVKVLRPELAAVMGAERFLSEIRTTANLQHPHILPLFDSGEAGGFLYYVMPFVEGESLRERLDRERQLPVAEAVRIATAVAGALSYAHEQGVIHRDIKPANILISRGEPLIADFGIALAVSQAGGGRVTQTGLSLGTPHYMSPEQATGDRQIDGRTDVYSLACVLYEALSGAPPHQGASPQSIIADILSKNPRPVRDARPSVPVHVEAALAKGLERLPADRFASVTEFEQALSNPSFRHGMPSATGRGASVGFWRAATLAASLVAAVVTVIALEPRTLPAAAPSLFEVTFSDSTTVALNNNSPNLALSPDGSLLAFRGIEGGGEGGLYVRAMNGMEARLVKAGQAFEPHFSPDGQWLLFYDGAGGVWRISADGGAPLPVVDNADVWGTSWIDDGEVLFARARGIWRVPIVGGEAMLVAQPDSARGHLFYRWPSALPDASGSLITLWKNGDELENAELGLIRFEDGEVFELGIQGTSPRYSRSGHIVFAREEGFLSAVRFDLRGLRVTGPVIPLRDGGRVMPPGGADFALSDSGLLVYQTGEGSSSELVMVDRRGVGKALPIPPRAHAQPRVSPDGRRIAMTSRSGPGSDVWTFELSSGTLSQLTNDGESQFPEWSPDGKRVATVTGPSSLSSAIQWQPWDGTGQAERYPGGEVPSFAISFGPTGSFAAIRRLTPDRAGRMSWNIWIAPLDGPTSSSLLIEHASTPAVSPDGKVIAYRGAEQLEIFVRSLTGPETRRQVSSGGGVEPVWSPDGRELFYIASGQLMSARIQVEPDLAVLGRDTLFSMMPFGGRGSLLARYDVFPSGDTFVVVRRLGAGGSRLLARTNWFEELRRTSDRTVP
jgi:serine/threonine protein kinase/Tol biopolymer transport system component